MNTTKKNFALVTGTSTGIGKAAAIELLSRGWEVVGTARRDTEINHENYTHINIDLSDAGSFVPGLTKNLKDKITGKGRNCLALINNAASAGEMLRMEEVDPVKLRDLYTLNLVAPTWLTGFFFKNKPGEARLRIVNLSSGAAHAPLPGLSGYCGTKAALRISGKIFAEENPDNRNLAILSYEPGTVDTEMQEQAKEQSPEKFPSYNMFKSFRDNDLLVKPEKVVKEIADFLEGSSVGYVEKRFGTNP